MKALRLKRTVFLDKFICYEKLSKPFLVHTRSNESLFYCQLCYTANVSHIKFYGNANTHTHAESPTAVGPVHNTNNLVGIVSTATIGFFVIVAILVIIAVGFSIQHWRRKR